MARTKMTSPDRKPSPRGEDLFRRQNRVQGGDSTSVQEGGSSKTTTDDSSARRYPAPAPAPRGGATKEETFARSSSSTSTAHSLWGGVDDNGAGLFIKSRGLTSSSVRYPAPSPARFAPPPVLSSNNGHPHPRGRPDQRHGGSVGQYDRQDGRISEQESRRGHDDGSSSWNRRDSNWGRRGIGESHRGCDQDGRSDRDYGRSHDHSSRDQRHGGRVGQYDRQDGRISEQKSRRGHDDGSSSWNRRDSNWGRRGIGESHRGCDQDGRSDRDYGRSHDHSCRSDQRGLSDYSHTLDRDDDGGRGHHRNDNSMPQKKRHKIRQACVSAPAKNLELPSKQTNQASLAPLPAPALVPPPAPLQGEHSDTDRLKRELDRVNYEKEISRANSEKKKIELESMRIDLEKKKIEQQLIQMSSNCAMPDDKTAAQPSAGNVSDVSTSQHLMDAGNCDFDGADDDVLPTRRSSNGNKKCAQKNFTNPSDSSKRKSIHCGNEQVKPSESTTSQQLGAHQARSEEKKCALLKADEKKLAIRKKKDKHKYTERDLKSSFTPNILDHYLLAKGERKFLVEWSNRRSKGLPIDDRLSPSWIRHENFLFPALARKYLTKKLKSKGGKDESMLMEWIEDCKEQERFLNCLNTIPGGDDDDDLDTEIDFCCYLCKCPRNHPLNGTIRHCGSECLSKYHRACCHEYQNKEEWESFVSPLGKVIIGGGDAIEITTRPDPEHEYGTEVEPDTNSVTIVDGNNEMFHKCLQTKQTRHAVVVCINAGVGSVAVALKGLGIRVEKMIHVEADRVAQHVIRSIHDYSYGVTQDNDEIKHVVGLYETVDDIAEAPEEFIKYNGPIDLVICTTPRGKSTAENTQFASKVIDLIEKLKRLNEEKHVHLHYLLEFPLCIKDQIPLHDLSHCICRPQNVHVCNWPIPPKIPRLAGLRAKHNLSGQPQDCLHPVKTLYDSLWNALSAGVITSSSAGQVSKKWRDVLHPKYWVFLGLGPKGYDLKVSNKEFRFDSDLLRLRSPDEGDFLTDVDYTQHLLEQSLSVPLLLILLSPLKDVFNEMNYGRAYRVEESENTSNNAADAAANDASEDVQVTEEVHDHGGTSSPNSNKAAHDSANDVSVDVQVKDEELIAEDMSTDDENDLFHRVEGGIDLKEEEVEVQEHSPNSNKAAYAASYDVSVDVQLKEEELEAEDMSSVDESELFHQVEGGIDFGGDRNDLLRITK